MIGVNDRKLEYRSLEGNPSSKVFASFHSFFYSGRSVIERLCIEEITDALSALGGITAVGALCFSRGIIFCFRKNSE